MKRSQRLTTAILFLAILLLLFSLYSTWLEYSLDNAGSLKSVIFFREYAINFGPEAAGIALTVLILDFLNERRSEQVLESQKKDQLIKEMQSRHNDTALTAVEKLRVYGWLEDGTIKGIDLTGARLQSANLWRANLEGINFGNTQLQNCSLRYANLTGAINLSNKQLIQVQALMRAIMPDGNKYDGRFNLARDIEHANQKGYDASDSQSMAKYLRISIEEYLNGQQWAEENLENLISSLENLNHLDENFEIQNEGSPLPRESERGEIYGSQLNDFKLIFVGIAIATLSSSLTLMINKILGKGS